MNAAALANSSLNDLLREKAIEKVLVDPEPIRRLRSQADKHILTAQGGVALDDNEGAFQLAYDSCRKSCTALVLAAGYRVTDDTDSHHTRVFEAAAALAASFGQRKLVVEAADLRYVRNAAEYRGEEVAPEDAEDAIDIAMDIARVVDQPIRRLLESEGY